MEASSANHQTAKWEVYPQLDNAFFHQARQAGITPLQAQLLHNRGLHDIAEMQKFLHADYDETRDPLLIIDMQRAVERIQLALHNKEHITVYGDYDADGVTSSALLYRALRTLKQADTILDYHIPNRQHDGCGLNLAALDMLKARGTQLIITTDCASSDIEQVDYARTLGIDVIITDHHHPPVEIPRAYAMVNPWRPDGKAEERCLCGAGIAFKLVQALYRASQRPIEDEKTLLDLVAIGTIGDIAPLLHDNHTFVRLGLERLNHTQKPGLKALIEKAQLQPGHIRERDIAFSIAPRINAAGRMKEASIAFDLLTTDDPITAARIAEELHQLNEQRRGETETLMNHVRIQAQNHPTHAVVLVEGDNWHEGIIGLVAGKLSEEINKPVLVLSNNPESGLSRGSARSQKGFNIIEALKSFGHKLERYGGHAQAAGFTIRHELIEELREHLLRWEASGGQAEPALIEGTDVPDPTGIVTEQESSEAAPPFTPNKVDLIFTKIDKISLQTYEEIRALAPFGAGNPDPVFKMEKMRLQSTWITGKKEPRNLRVRFSAQEPTKGQTIGSQTGTYMREAAQKERIDRATLIDIIFRIETYNENDTEIWLKLLSATESVDNE